tara:strand:+ start:91 stop:480 length:390 start_codon:yes stop_codon:yes gene_type:complete
MKKITTKKLREFGLFVGISFPTLLGFILPSIRGHSFAGWTLYIGFPLTFLALVKPDLLNKPYKLWISFGNLLALINSRIILGLVFILILQPISLFMKFFGYDPLKLKKQTKSTYKEINKGNKVDLTRIF